MKIWFHIVILPALAAAGCATPPEVKQAVANEDVAYSGNLKLMQQYQQLAGCRYMVRLCTSKGVTGSDSTYV